ncbi:MAG: alpha/beta hydrolase [Gammaproteobacteria bacterium]
MIENKRKKSFNYSVCSIESDGAKLALHSWVPEKPKAMVYYIHGIQSHAGWLFETGSYFAEKGIAVFVVDRRGSGKSEGIRGDIGNHFQLLNDYLKILRIIRSLYIQLPLTLIGQSLGGSILSALLALPDYDVEYNKVVFCASALGKKHNEVSAIDYARVISESSMDLIDIPIKDEDFSDQSKYLDFISSDPLLYRKITKRSLASLLLMENLYLSKPGLLSEKQAVYVCPEEDPIVNLDYSISVFQKLTNEHGEVKRFQTYKHYLWFTDQSMLVHQWIVNWILSTKKEVLHEDFDISSSTAA